MTTTTRSLPPALVARMGRELQMLSTEPPPGVCAWPKDDARLDRLEADIEGPPGTCYENGVFRLDIVIPDRYPFEPPKVRFVTPIYHPNIDNGGRICLDTLKSRPKGSWLPSVNISTLLSTIRLLMANPNADDGLMPDITHIFKTDRPQFERIARAETAKHAGAASKSGAVGSGAAPPPPSSLSSSSSSSAATTTTAPALPHPTAKAAGRASKPSSVSDSERDSSDSSGDSDSNGSSDDDDSSGSDSESSDSESDAGNTSLGKRKRENDV